MGNVMVCTLYHRKTQLIKLQKKKKKQGKKNRRQASCKTTISDYILNFRASIKPIRGFLGGPGGPCSQYRGPGFTLRSGN